ncbi:MAG TPA: AMP-binding protein [Planctomycetota bacterium]|nr:AMP-binding protein [Planctomycetota bacterium]
MLGAVYIALERWMRGNTARISRWLDRMPVWYPRTVARAKLGRTLRHVWDNAPAQRERWRAVGVRRGDLRNPRVLETLPMVTGDDLVERPDDFRCVPRDRLIHVLGTSGTRGRPKRIYLTAADLDRQVSMIGTNMRRYPGASRALAVFLVDNPTWSSGMIARRGAQAAGMLALLSGSHRDVADQVALIREYDVDFLITTPSYLHRITLEADVDLRTLGVRYIQLSGQPWTETFRAEMQAAWGAKLLDVYASSEFACGIASECIVQRGLHLAEADFWCEVIDPATGRVLDEGEEGELVLTTLSRWGMPLVRYRTGDLARLLPFEGRCTCGMPLRKMSRVRGRVDGVVILGGGNNVYPDEFDRAVLDVDGVTEYQLVLERKDGIDVLHLAVETGAPAGVARETLVDALLSVPMVRTAHRVERTLDFGRLEAVPPGTLSDGRPKTDRIVDRRDVPRVTPEAT